MSPSSHVFFWLIFCQIKFPNTKKKIKKKLSARGTPRVRQKGGSAYVLGCELDAVVEEDHDLVAVEEVVLRGRQGRRKRGGKGAAADGRRAGSGAGALELVVVGAERERRRRLRGLWVAGWAAVRGRPPPAASSSGGRRG
jgi:hypothetical protein